MARSNHTLEIGTGLFVLLGFAALAFLTTQLPGSGLQISGGAPSYSVTAEFDDIGGLKVGAPVTMAGVRIGKVAVIGIDPADYRARVTLGIEKRYAQIPDDSDAAINTAGLLGANYIAVTAGSSDKFLHAGSEISFTQSALVLENIVNKFFANSASGGSSSSGSGSGASGAPGATSSGASGGGANGAERPKSPPGSPSH
ncbi:MAG TPA: outer membrane lipid asymmetry maintenance protein MlaD [Steroidobacteraceae bacterium]|jgi:phospholipid/cholesterol/gamma-HCH transport system substrate-binding protein|nr:outer membrane lipid asymmetry maintenance protein MlaD [Steroidobacteraceae bacterium]